MLMFRWILKILPFLTILGIRKKYQKRVSLMKIEVAKAYVLGIGKIRFFSWERCLYCFHWCFLRVDCC